MKRFLLLCLVPLAVAAADWTPLSNYVLRVEYRFVGEQTKGGPGWAFRNNGAMLHCPHPETMSKDQDFPVSIEVQLLGGPVKGERTTANICSPGTHIVMDGKLETRHCINSKSKTYHGDQWVTVEIEVRADGSSRHIMRGGYISLQAESHPIEFRKVEVRPLGK